MALSPGTRLGPYVITTAADPDFRRRFDREARVISSLNHPHICVLHDVGRQDEIDFLVMEYLEGETLAQRLAKGALPLAQALRYASEIADALDKAHRKGIVHRDLKPGNVMLTQSGAKLLDFGVAKLRAAEAGRPAAASVAATATTTVHDSFGGAAIPRQHGRGGGACTPHDHPQLDGRARAMRRRRSFRRTDDGRVPGPSAPRSPGYAAARSSSTN